MLFIPHGHLPHPLILTQPAMPGLPDCCTCGSVAGAPKQLARSAQSSQAPGCACASVAGSRFLVNERANEREAQSWLPQREKSHAKKNTPSCHHRLHPLDPHPLPSTRRHQLPPVTRRPSLHLLFPRSGRALGHSVLSTSLTRISRIPSLQSSHFHQPPCSPPSFEGKSFSKQGAPALLCPPSPDGTPRSPRTRSSRCPPSRRQ
jgi:hypothetical protein